MAKGGKGRKGGGGGGGKTRKYSRDNNGRFAATGTGATARGGRLLTAKGNKRKTQTITAAGKKGVLAKPKGLKPGSIKPAAKPSAAAKPAANKVVASPRRLSGDQKIARDVMTNKKLTSDRQRVAEMQRRGIKPGTDMVGLVAGVRAKQGGDSTSRIKPAAKPSAAAKPAAKKARTDESAFGDRFKRAGKVGLKRSIKESDNLNNPTGKATFEKRFAATQQRQSQADRTAAAAKDFYTRFGSSMSFAQRPKLSTAGGARFGVKKKPNRKPRSMR